MTVDDNSKWNAGDIDLGGTGLGGTDLDGTDLGGIDLGGIDLGGIDLRRVWTGVAAEVWRRRPGRIERIATRLLRSPGLARALLTTPSLLVPWLISTAVAFLAGGIVDLAGGQPVAWILAPAVAAIGIAYSYGPGIDPAWELACTMPVSERMVLLVRAVAVFAVNAVLGMATSAITYSAIPGRLSAHATEITIGWLLPMTAVCALTLAVAVTARSASAGASAGVFTWAAVVLASRTSTGQLTAAVTDTATYLPYLAVAVCATVVIGYVTRTPHPYIQRPRTQGPRMQGRS
jgi:hypothetical protein